MTFFYHGEERVCLWFDSPNHSATFCGMLLAALITYTSNPLIFGRLGRSAKSAIYVSIGVLSIILILTYSRGGWLAFIASLITYISLHTNGRRLIITYLAVFVALILIMPQAIDRVGSLTSDDPSIYNRLYVWKGAMDITASFPICGIGKDQFCQVFSSWFEPLTMTTRYWTSLNNYLTVAAEYGLFALFGYLFLLFTPILLAWNYAEVRKMPGILSICMSLLVYIISSWFTYNLNCLFLDVLALLLWMTLVAKLFQWVAQGHSIRLYGIGKNIFLASIIACLMLYVLGRIDISNLPTKTVREQIESSNSKDIVTVIYPQHRVILGVVAYLQDEHVANIYDSRKWIRPLGERGFITVSLVSRKGGKEGLSQSKRLLQNILAVSEWEKMPIFIVGSGEGGQIGMLTDCSDIAGRVNGVIAVGSNCSWPFEELSPNKHIDEIKSPLLLLQSADDTMVSLRETEAFSNLVEQKHKAIKVIVFNGVDHELNSQWDNAFNDVVSFLKANCTPRN